jgi:hypothetical protein
MDRLNYNRGSYRGRFNTYQGHEVRGRSRYRGFGRGQVSSSIKNFWIISYVYLVAFLNAGSLKPDQNLALSISFFTFGFKIPVS